MPSKSILHLTGADVHHVFNEVDLALIPTGSVEYHGPHAALGTDSFIAEELVRRVSQRLDALVCPLIPYSACPVRTVPNPGTIHINPDVMTAYLEDLFRSLLRQGVQGILVVNAHDANMDTVKRAADRVVPDFPQQFLLLINWWQTLPTAEIKDMALFSYQGGHGHGGPLETSAAWAVARDSVDLSQAPDIEMDFGTIPMLSILGYGQQAPDWPGYSGRISEASPEKGETLLKLAADKIVEITQTWLAKGQ